MNLIRKVAWSFHQTTGIPYEDLFSEACLAYCQSVSQYTRERKIKRVTWSFIFMKRKLIDYCRKENNYHLRVEFTEIIPDRYVEKSKPEWVTKVEKDEYLSQILFILTYKKYRDSLTPYKIKQLIKNDLINELGWDEKQVKENFDKIKMMIC